MTVRELWPHQKGAVDAVLSAWLRGVKGPAAVIPTGGGKTAIKAAIGRDWLELERARLGVGGRILVIAHREELLSQIQAAFRRDAPDLTTGIVKGTQNEAAADVVIASVLTLGGRDDRRRRMVRNVRAVLIDECHHAAADTYQRVIGHYGVPYAGVTATLTRTDSRALGGTFGEVVYVKGIADMIAAGFLVRPRGVRVKVADLDLDAVRRAAGDLQAGQLGEAIEQSLAPEAIAKAIWEQCPNDQGFVFAPTVHAAGVIADAMRATGLTAEVVTGKTPTAERASVLVRFRAGEIAWLVNVGVFTEGTDLPMARVAVIARPTQSVGLYIQMVGRVLRRWCYEHGDVECSEQCPSRKRDALLLDVVGATRRHRLASPIDLFGEEQREAKEVIDDLGLDIDLGLDDDEDDADPLEEPPLGGASGPLEYSVADLFASSKATWHQTPRGVHYLRGLERFVAILPGIEAGTWDVWSMHMEQAGRSQVVARGFASQNDARQIAEAQQSATEKRAHRYGKRASEALLQYAARWGVNAPEGISMSELEDLLDAAKAVARIDHNVPWYAQSRLPEFAPGV